jgi:hypothetical protein
MAEENVEDIFGDEQGPGAPAPAPAEDKSGEDKPAPAAPADQIQRTINDIPKLVSEAVAKAVASLYAGAPPSAPPAAEEKPITDDDFFTKPVEATEKLVAKVVQRELAPYVQTYLESQPSLILANFRSNKQFPLFSRFEDEIVGLLNKLPADARLNPKNIEYAYYQIVGRHHQELAEEAAKRVPNMTPDSQTPNVRAKSKLPPEKVGDFGLVSSIEPMTEDEFAFYESGGSVFAVEWDDNGIPKIPGRS